VEEESTYLYVLGEGLAEHSRQPGLRGVRGRQTSLAMPGRASWWSPATRFP